MPGMRKTTVFRFRYLDRASGAERLSDDWATAEAIAHMGGVIEPDTALEVDVSEVSATAGLLLVKRGVA
jgi:hypothetical protein